MTLATAYFQTPGASGAIFVDTSLKFVFLVSIAVHFLIAEHNLTPDRKRYFKYDKNI